MAVLGDLPYSVGYTDPYDYKAQIAVLDGLQKASDALPAGSVKGVLLAFPVADGYAQYLVTKARPLTLVHLPYLDGYSVPDAHIRGLNAADVAAQHSFRIKYVGGK